MYILCKLQCWQRREIKVTKFENIFLESWRYWVQSSSGRVWTRDRQHAGSTLIRSTASNLEQFANLLCAQANSASYPQRDGKWVVAYLAWATEWRPSVADWGGGMSASCTAGPIVR